MTLRQAKAIGGNEWKTGSHHRVYFNDLATRAELHTEHYGSGNICSATLDGEQISNTQARKLAHYYDSAKLWWDVRKDRFHWQGLGDDDAAELVAQIQAEVVGA